MKFTAALSTVAAVSVSFNTADAAILPRQTRSIAAVGVTNNGVQNRVELRQMQRNNPDQYNLYLLGLRRFMSVDQSDPLSYYQIAGIHGRPYIPYDGWTSPGGSSGYGGGYCTHVSNIFATWHRPYLALFEQTLYTHVQAVANSYPAGDRRNRYVAAAANFRIPYWDWAAPKPCSDCFYYPKLVSQASVTIDDPVNGVQTVLNPLFRYDFHTASGASQSNDFVYDPFVSWSVTKRAPTSFDAAGMSQNANVDSSFNDNTVRGYASRLVNLFSNYNNFNQFSNEAWQSSSGTANADSLESLHDAIHAATGQNGHMTYLDYSAFDPIFWLHHANIDRLWAMWSTIYPNSYVPTSGTSSGSTFMTPQNSQSNVNSPLYPFSKNTNRQLWTSADVRSPSTFGYSYADISGGASGVRSVVNNLYNGGAASSKKKRDLSALSKRDDGHNYHYVANIVSQKWKLKGSYGVYLFIGEPSSTKPTDWFKASNLVGFHGVTAMLDGMSDMDTPVTGTVPITPTLLDLNKAGTISDLTPNTVQPYLKKNLVWKVAMFDGTTIDPAQVPDLSVTVVVADVAPASSKSELDTWGAFTALPNITSDKAGGHVDKFWQFDDKKSTGENVRRALFHNLN